MAPTGEKPNLHTLPAELLRWTSSFLDSSSALALSTVHSGTQIAAERQLWTSLYVSLPPHYGQHPWDESLPYPSTFHPGLTRQYALRSRLQGILEVFRADPSKRLLVKDLHLEIDSASAPDMVDLLVSLSGQLETLSICARETEPTKVTANPRSRFLESTEAQPFHDLLALRDFRLDKLTSLTLKHKTNLYLFNLHRILERCPNLIKLTVKGGDKASPSPPVDIFPALANLERLDIVGTRLEPLEFINDILGKPNKLKHLRIADKSYVGVDRHHPSNTIPPAIDLVTVTDRLRNCSTLKTLVWKYEGLPLAGIVNLDECSDGTFRNVEKVWIRSNIYCAPMVRLEFLDLPQLPNLKELYIVESSLPKCAMRSQRSGSSRRLQTASLVAPDGFLPRVLERIRSNPQLERIHFPDFECSLQKTHKLDREIGNKHAGAIVRSYLHPTYGELLLVRIHTKSREFFESHSDVFAHQPSTTPTRSTDGNAVPAIPQLPSGTQAQNAPPVINLLVTFGIPRPTATYTIVPRWLALHINTQSYGPTTANHIVLANYGPTNVNPITFAVNGPAQTSVAASPPTPTPPIVSPEVPRTQPASAVVQTVIEPQPSSSSSDQPSSDTAIETITQPSAKPQGLKVPVQVDSEPPNTSADDPHDTLPQAPQLPADGLAVTPTVVPSTFATTAPLPALPHATTGPPISVPSASSQDDTLPARPVSPPPRSSISKLWEHYCALVHPPSNGTGINPHAAAVAAVAALAAQPAQPTVAAPTTAPSVAPTTAYSGTPATDPSPSVAASEDSSPPLSQSITIAPTEEFASPVPSTRPESETKSSSQPQTKPLRDPFDKTARKLLKNLPLFQLNPERTFPPPNVYALTPRETLPSNTMVIFDTHAARLYHTPPSFPFPPFTPPDHSYDRPGTTVRSFVTTDWHWEEYALFNGRILHTEVVAKWKLAAGVEAEWKTPGRGLTTNEDAWMILKQWEGVQEVAWEEERAGMQSRRRAERAEEMANLGREVKGKSRATSVDEPIPEVPMTLQINSTNEGMDQDMDGPVEAAIGSKEAEQQAAAEQEERMKQRRQWIAAAVSQDEAGPSQYHSPDTTME